MEFKKQNKRAKGKKERGRPNKKQSLNCGEQTDGVGLGKYMKEIRSGLIAVVSYASVESLYFNLKLVLYCMFTNQNLNEHLKINKGY